MNDGERGGEVKKRISIPPKVAQVALRVSDLLLVAALLLPEVLENFDGRAWPTKFAIIFARAACALTGAANGVRHV